MRLNHLNRPPDSLIWMWLALLPLAALVAAILRYRVDVPFGDEWSLIPLIEKSYQGILTLGDLWRQENDHRLFFPKIIFILAVRLSGWNVTSLLIVNLVLAMSTFTLLWYQTKRTLAEAGCSGIQWLIPAISLLVFSLNQWENWLWGIELCIFLNTFSVIAGFVALSVSRFRWRHFLVAVVLGVIATYSNANGVIFWPVGLLVLWFRPSEERKTKGVQSGLWALLGLLVIGSYLYHYQRPSYLPSHGLWVREPVRYAQFVLTYLGGPLASFSPKGALGVGLSGLLLFFIVPRTLLRHRRVPFETLIPHLSIGLYFIGTALMVGIGRLGFGLNRAMNGYYVTQTYPFWTSLLVLIRLLFRPERAHQKGAPSPAWAGAFSAFVLLAGCSSLYGISGLRQFHERLSLGRVELVSRAEGAPLKRLTSTEPSRLDKMIAILKKRRLSVFRDA